MHEALGAVASAFSAAQGTEVWLDGVAESKGSGSARGGQVTSAPDEEAERLACLHRAP